MRIMATGAVSPRNGLPLVSGDELRILGIVAPQAQLRRSFGEVKIELLLAHAACLVGHVTGTAAHVECGMPAALVRHAQTLAMAAEA